MSEPPRRVPASALLGQLAQGTATVLHALSERLEAASARRGSQRELSGPRQRGPFPQPADQPLPGLRDLIDESVLQGAAAARVAFLRRIVDELLPDEARIVVKLGEVGAVPLMHIRPRRGRGPGLEYASLVGRLAGVTVPSLTPDYVRNLARLGLVEVGPEAERAEKEYELLMADRAVRSALRSGALGKIPARVVRRTVQLSDRGREVVSTCTDEAPL